MLGVSEVKMRKEAIAGLFVLSASCTTANSTERQLQSILNPLVDQFAVRWESAKSCKEENTWRCRAAALTVISWIEALECFDNSVAAQRLRLPLATEQAVATLRCVPSGSETAWPCDLKESILKEGGVARSAVLDAWQQAEPIVSRYERARQVRAQIADVLVAAAASGPARSRRGVVTDTMPDGSAGIPVYDADECVGPVVAGVCHGGILPKKAYRPRCYGKMLNGHCTGPMF